MSISARRYSILPSFNDITAHDRISTYTSAPFKFIIDGNPLYIHAELVSRHSKPLDRMINGHMTEAQSGFAVIEDVDEGTFVRFIQWAYNGYYEAGEFKIDSPTADSTSPNGKMGSEPYLKKLAPGAEGPYPEGSLVEDIVDFNREEHEATVEDTVEVISEEDRDYSTRWERSSGLTKSTKSEKKVKKVGYISTGTSSASRRILKESFIRRKPLVRKEAINISPPRPNQASNEDYTEVFLSHARVYVFAEKYDIQLLKALALDELHATLQNFNLYPERTGDIISLLRYIYANTGEIVDGVEDMRSVLKHYLGFEMYTLMKDNDFGDLMIEDGGALLGDFMKMVEQRIRRHENVPEPHIPHMLWIKWSISQIAEYHVYSRLGKDMDSRTSTV